MGSKISIWRGSLDDIGLKKYSVSLLSSEDEKVLYVKPIKSQELMSVKVS